MHEGITPTIIGEATVTPWLPRPKRGRNQRWTDAELAVLRAHYPTGGLAACQCEMPGRTEESILKKAQALGLRGRGMPLIIQKWTTTEHIDNAIRRTYAGEAKKGAIKRLAKSIGRPAWWISARARALGVQPTRRNGPEWTPEETEILLANAHKQPITIMNILRRRGFKRSTMAIVVRLTRLHADRTDDDHYSGNDLAALMGIDAAKLKSWIDRGLLVAKRKSAAGRSHYLIHRRSVRRFIVDNVGAVDIRRVDKFWLVDLLAGRAEA